MTRYPRTDLPAVKGDPYISVKISVSDDSFESTFSIPVTATPEQINSFTKSWLGTLAEVIKFPSQLARESPTGQKGAK